MAMALMRKWQEELGKYPGQVLKSVDTWTTDDITSSENAIVSMHERGLDLATHLYRGVMEELLAVSELVLTMVSNNLLLRGRTKTRTKTSCDVQTAHSGVLCCWRMNLPLTKKRALGKG
jgi:protein-tyrosine-phosphatase